jgi:hypothetical protein
MNCSIKEAAMNANQCRPLLCDPRNAISYLLESNTYTIAELTQSVFKRENSCVLRVIDDMLYLQ